jgi:phospholipase/carboxylesterase
MTGPEERQVQGVAWTYYDLFVPRPGPAAPLVVALHGYGGEKSGMMRLARRLTGDRCAVISLQGPHEHLIRPENPSEPLGFGFGWLTNFKPERSIERHHRAILEVLGAITREGGVDPDRIFLLGFSQSVALNFRFAFTNPERVRGIVGICGGIPGDWRTEGKYRKGDFDVLLVSGERDEFYPPDRVRANAEALRSKARSVDVEIVAGGHEISPEASRAAERWLSTRI